MYSLNLYATRWKADTVVSPLQSGQRGPMAIFSALLFADKEMNWDNLDY